ncbi:hypothetical protein [Aquisphaera insulae]|uniref:hypothetical protein n=1 Tax=Aquisphaera insulae TaxID=2712864 RepID=UPI0013EAB991|nr:hypothetical protein [Aquisphaera insulae]
MSDSSLDRVREDLAVMRRAVGLGHPFEWEHVWACLALACVGGALAVITAVTGISVKPAAPGSASHLAYLGLLLVPVALALGLMATLGHRRKEAAPLFWREQRHSWVAAVVVVPLYVGFTIWGVKNGLAAGTLTAATFFLAGLFSVAAAVSERDRRYTLGFGLSTLLAGAICPWVGYEGAGLLVGGWLALGGVSTAIVMARQLRSGVEHATD